MTKIIMPMARPATVSVTQVDGLPMKRQGDERQRRARAAAAANRVAAARQFASASDGFGGDVGH